MKDYIFQSFESREEIPLDDVTGIVTEQSQVMHGRLPQDLKCANDPNAHVSASLEKIDEVIPPNGRMFLVRDPEGGAIGFGAIRRLDNKSAEMKHLFVRDTHRGKGLGRRLVELRLEDARVMGVRTVFADTIGLHPEMPALYTSMGFERIEPAATSGTLKAAPKIAECLIFFRKDL